MQIQTGFSLEATVRQVKDNLLKAQDHLILAKNPDLQEMMVKLAQQEIQNTIRLIQGE